MPTLPVVDEVWLPELEGAELLISELATLVRGQPIHPPVPRAGRPNGGVEGIDKTARIRAASVLVVSLVSATSVTTR